MAKSNKHLEVFRTERMLNGETVVTWTKAIRDGQGFEGAAILTDHRIVFIRKGLGSTKFEAWPLSQVTSVETQRGMFWFKITLHISGDHMGLQTAEKDVGQEFADEIQRLRNSKPRQQRDEVSAIEQLERLAALRDSQAISEEEFAVKKRELLAKIA